MGTLARNGLRENRIERKLLLSCRGALRKFFKNLQCQLYISSFLLVTFIKMNIMQYHGKKHLTKDLMIIRKHSSLDDVILNKI